MTITSTKLTAPYSQSSSVACLSFWYYIDSDWSFTLYMGVIMGSVSITDIQVTGRQVTNSWQQAKTDAALQANQQLFIKLDHKTNGQFQGGLAIDDIKITPGRCHYDAGMQCEFTAYSSCGFQSTGYGYPTQASSRGVAYGPPIDHTSGAPTGYYYLFYKRGVATNGYYKSSLTIPNLATTGFRAQCLRFWYQINTPSVSSLYIYVMPNTQTNPTSSPLWIPPSSNFTDWTRGQVTIYASYVHKVQFSLFMSTTAANTSFVALDDISLTPGTCETPVTCNFDEDFCNWGNTLSGNLWRRFTGTSTK